MTYRQDIDGLRAIAVLLVIIFHAKVGVLSGGFVGVDIFFVISGYLITSILLRDIKAPGRFSLLSFYERRIRRIFPALISVILFSSVTASLIFLPVEFKDFGQSLVATGLFLSNMLFWKEAGYFAGPSELKPLLHTWSLAVEEQIYIVFPLFVAWFSRYAKGRWLITLLVVMAISFATSIWCLNNAPVFAFYGTPARAWEFLLGSCLAVRPIPNIRYRTIQEAIPVVGLGLIAWSALTFSEDTSFPGFNALFPCLGTALIISSGQNGPTLTSRVLSLSPLVFIGLISYSLYLWHWPLIVFAEYYKLDALSPLETASVIALSFALATLSWKYIEQPFRKGRIAFQKIRTFSAASIAMAAAMAFGVFVHASKGWTNRLPAEILHIAAAAQSTPVRRDECAKLSVTELKNQEYCFIGDLGKSSTDFALLGDSHSDVMREALGVLAEKHGAKGIYLGKYGCPPLHGVERDIRSLQCKAHFDFALNHIKKQGIKHIIFISRWMFFTSKPSYGSERNPPVILSDNNVFESEAQNDTVFRRALQRTIDQLSAHTIYLSYAIPEIGFNVPTMFSRRKITEQKVPKAPTFDDYWKRQKFVTGIFLSLASNPKYDLRFIYPHNVFCDGLDCKASAGGKILYQDDDHLSRAGAKYLAPLYEPIFKGMSSPPRIAAN